MRHHRSKYGYITQHAVIGHSIVGFYVKTKCCSTSSVFLDITVKVTSELDANPGQMANSLRTIELAYIWVCVCRAARVIVSAQKSVYTSYSIVTRCVLHVATHCQYIVFYYYTWQRIVTHCLLRPYTYCYLLWPVFVASVTDGAPLDTCILALLHHQCTLALL